VAATSKAKQVASMTLQVDRSKRVKLDDWEYGIQAEGADSPKEAQTEGADSPKGARPEGAAAAPEDGEFPEGEDRRLPPGEDGRFLPDNGDPEYGVDGRFPPDPTCQQGSCKVWMADSHQVLLATVSSNVH
jgi:hypothetical protein